MKVSHSSRNAFGMCAAVAMLAGCGGSRVAPTPAAPQFVASQSAAADLALHATPLHRHRMTFGYTGELQHFTVPTGVTQLRVTASGAAGASPGGRGGYGGLVKATIPVTPGEVLAIHVGGSEFAAGASDVRQGGDTLMQRVAVAGGGGGGGAAGFCGSAHKYPGGAGGNGGDLVGGQGSGNAPGSGGTQSNGGQAGNGGSPGRLGHGGKGGVGLFGIVGGRGGGGYYGGGGGGSGFCSGTIGFGGSGGGGGSSYVEASATHVIMLQGGGSHSNGSIVLSW